MSSLGFSTGALFPQYETGETIQIYRNLKIEVLEICIGTPAELENFDITTLDPNLWRNFRWISVHAPFFKITYDTDDDTRKMLNKLKSICDILPVRAVVFHPSNIHRFTVLEGYDFPVMLENMDTKKSIAIRPEEFIKYRTDYPFAFVLDVEHAYEHDNSMLLANELLDAMGERLSHLHFSGQNPEQIHSLLINAHNQTQIIDFYQKNHLYRFPTINEGGLSDKYQQEILTELKLIQSCIW